MAPYTTTIDVSLETDANKNYKKHSISSLIFKIPLLRNQLVHTHTITHNYYIHDILIINIVNELL